jgi:hypothetical protein
VSNSRFGKFISWLETWVDDGPIEIAMNVIVAYVAWSTTDMRIVSDHGNEYTLQLRDVCGDEDPHFGSKSSSLPSIKLQETGWLSCPSLRSFKPDVFAADLEHKSFRYLVTEWFVATLIVSDAGSEISGRQSRIATSSNLPL